MVTTLKRITTNYNFNIPVFDAPNWGSYMEKNFDIIDAALYAITGFGNVKGAWSNSTIYSAGDRVVDPSDNSIWQAAVSHTSAGTGSFAADRTAHPTYWNKVANTIVNRGQWAAGTSYNTNEFVQDGQRFGVVLEPYTSGASYDADVAAGHIQTIIDVSSQLAQTNADKIAADASADAAATSEANALAYKNAAASSASSADTSEANALSYKNAAAASASAAATSEDNADASEAAALSYKNAAAASATAAATSEDNAATSETNAAASEALAQKWANNPEDVVVSGGLYSALHWAKKAMAAVLDTAAQITFAPAGNISATNVQDAVEELDTEKVRRAGDTMTGELVFGPGNNIRHKTLGEDATTGYGFFWRVDANNLYLLKTALDNPDGGWANPFPLQIRASDGVMFNNGLELMPDRIKPYPPAYTSGNLDNITDGGWYFVNSSAISKPIANFGYMLVLPLDAAGRCKQIWYNFNSNRVFARESNPAGTWSTWEEWTSNKTYLDATYGRLGANNTWNSAHQFNGDVNVSASASFTQGTRKVLIDTDTNIFQPTLGFTPVQQGGGSGMLTNKVYIGWAGSQDLLLAQVDASPQGTIYTTQVNAGASPCLRPIWAPYNPAKGIPNNSEFIPQAVARLFVDGVVTINMSVSVGGGLVDYRILKNGVQLTRAVDGSPGGTISVNTSVSKGDTITWEALGSGATASTVTLATISASKYVPVGFYTS